MLDPSPPQLERKTRLQVLPLPLSPAWVLDSPCALPEFLAATTALRPPNHRGCPAQDGWVEATYPTLGSQLSRASERAGDYPPIPFRPGPVARPPLLAFTPVVSAIPACPAPAHICSSVRGNLPLGLSAAWHLPHELNSTRPHPALLVRSRISTDRSQERERWVSLYW